MNILDIMHQRLKKSFPEGKIRLENPQGDLVHFELEVISAAFSGKTRVEQHQMVYRALGDVMDQAVHALALKTSASC